MPCPYAGGADSHESVGREDFLRSTLVIGGRDALQATLMRYGPPELDSDRAPPRSGGQYDWADECADHGGDAAGCPVDHDSADGQDHSHGYGDAGGETGDEYDDFHSEWPAYHVVYRLRYEGEDPAGDRRRLTQALSGVTERVGWGTDGITWAVGYASRHLGDVSDAVPEPLRPARVGDLTADGGREVAGDCDCLLHLASDEPRRLLVAEALLWDGTEGLAVDASIDDTVADAYPRPTSAPERLVTIGPHGVDAPSVDGEAVVQLSGLEEDPDDAADGEAAECPADHEAVDGSPDGAHGDGGDDAGENGPTNAVDLRHLNPASPGVLRVELCTPETSDPKRERYYLPAADDRAVTGAE